MRLRTGYLDRSTADLDEALRWVQHAPTSRSRSACWATPPRCSPNWCAAACARMCVTDQTSAHDPLNGYLPPGWTVAEWETAARSGPPRRRGRARRGMVAQVQAMLDWHAMGVPTLDYGNNIRQMALEEGVGRRLRLPGLRARLHPPAVLPRRRAVPLGGAVRRPRGHLPHRCQGARIDPDDPHLHRWLDLARERIRFQGLPARICWVGLGDRHRLRLGLQRDGRDRRAEGPHRDRARPPGQRLRREPEPGDGGDGRMGRTRCPTGRC